MRDILMYVRQCKFVDLNVYKKIIVARVETNINAIFIILCGKHLYHMGNKLHYNRPFCSFCARTL